MSSDSLSSDEDNLEVAASTEEEETLEQFMNDDSKVSPADRIQTMISLCFAYVKDFSTDVAPLFDHERSIPQQTDPLISKSCGNSNVICI